jgi:hypothetical protein
MLKTVSVHTYLWGQHDYNSQPNAPLGCKVEAHIVPEVRETWAPHTAIGYYIGNSDEHYRCHTIYITNTKSTRICSTVLFKHKYLTMPTFTPADALIKAADDLTAAIAGNMPPSTITDNAITQLLQIFKQQANSTNDAVSAQRVLIDHAQRQRVHNEEETTSTPTTPTAILTLTSSTITASNHTTSTITVPTAVPTTNMEFPPLQIEETITTADTTPASNTRQQQTLRTITQDCAFHLTEATSQFTPPQARSRKYHFQLLSDWAQPVLDDDTGDLLEYRHLNKHPQHKVVWTSSFGKEIRRLATTTKTLGFKSKTEIPTEQRKDITYGRIVCTYRSEKKDPYRTRITMGGNLIN